MRPFVSDGYLDEKYALALAEIGHPRKLAGAGTWILERPILGSALKDAIGCYPLFCCANWNALIEDLQDTSDLVSLVVVTDPFGSYDTELLRQCFPDLSRPFKRHYVTDLARDPKEFISNHHNRNIEKSLADVHVERCADPSKYSDIWIDLYRQLTLRHSITGISSFSPESLKKQLIVRGLEMFRGIVNGETVGIVLWVLQDGVAYYHLAAYSDLGYQMRSSYALFWIALQDFAQRGLRWVNLGASPGLSDNESDGLTRFKKGWATGTKSTYICGRVLNADAYNHLLLKCAGGTTDYFPGYRCVEYGELSDERPKEIPGDSPAL